jgi:two-component system, LytTR family, response regulator
MPLTIFTTAYDQFALRAFDAHAIDYILKPYDAERFEQGLERARDALAARRRAASTSGSARCSTSCAPAAQYAERLVVRSGGRIVILRIAEIDWIEAASNYVRLHAAARVPAAGDDDGAGGEADPAEFVRIHRSTIVRVDRIRELEPLFQGDYVVILTDGTRLTSSRGYRERLQELLQGSS